MSLKAERVSVHLASPHAAAVIEKFEKAGIPLNISFLRVTTSAFWYAKLGDHSFAALPLEAASENYKGREICGVAAHTPDAAIMNLNETFRSALNSGRLIGVHRYAQSVTGEQIDNISFLGGSADKPEIVARINYCAGEQTHPLTLTKMTR